jgi:cytoplasmic iron level regulating protein YaaA (DUF328/UPF0246 family)
MLFLLSPAKTLDFESPLPPLKATEPAFPERTAKLVQVLQRKSARQLSKLMDISDNLGQLNAQRYKDWAGEPGDDAARPAVLAFAGDVYDGLQAGSLSPADLEWAQDHLCILSGLYGLLRPLDRIQPYRLEMGTALTVGRKKNLYQFWGGDIADTLNERLAQAEAPVVVNLASQEYFRSVDTSRLAAPVVECVFEDAKGDGPFKVISFFAKKARGAMARFAIQNRIGDPAQLEAFDTDGYRFAKGESSPGRLVFRRTITP